MRYADGQIVELGDVVDLGGKMTGTVVMLFAEGLFAHDFPRDYWAGLPDGMMISSKEAGLVHYPEEGNSRLVLIRRSNPRIS